MDFLTDNMLNKLYYYLINISYRRFWDNIFRWLSYYGISRRIYDFDCSSVLEVERHQIFRIKKTLKFRTSRDIERINLAISLISIILEEDNFLDCSEGKWIMNKYVNTRNSNRFGFSDRNLVTHPVIKNGLRQEKAWHLYHKLRLYHLREWWD